MWTYSYYLWHHEFLRIPILQQVFILQTLWWTKNQLVQQLQTCAKETPLGLDFLIATTNQRSWTQISNLGDDHQMGKIYFNFFWIYSDPILNFLHFLCNFVLFLIYDLKIYCLVYYTFTSSSFVIISSYFALLLLNNFSHKQIITKQNKKIYAKLSDWILKNKMMMNICGCSLLDWINSDITYMYLMN